MELKRWHVTVQTRACSLPLHAHPKTFFMRPRQALQWLRYRPIDHLLRVMHKSRIYLFPTLQQTRNLLHSLMKKLGKPRQGTGEIAHCLRELVVLPENQSLVPCTYIQWLTAICVTPVRFWLWVVYMWHTHRKRQVYTHTYIRRYSHTHMYTHTFIHTFKLTKIDFS